jgi:hypothetical protein
MDNGKRSDPDPMCFFCDGSGFLPSLTSQRASLSCSSSANAGRDGNLPITKDGATPGKQ